jgi:hypothetical protein
MKPPPQVKRFRLTPIAATGDCFCDFAPYVASVNDAGTVAFYAVLTGGSSGVFTGSGGPIATVVDTAAGFLAGIDSHPDINTEGAVSFYAHLREGGSAI